MSEKQHYAADNIQVLKGLEAVRVRPAMYIGDIGVRGLHHLVYEVVDNSIDEALEGFCDTISVTIHEDNAISVSDNGRGIPVDIHKEEGRSALEIVMTVLHAGGKFDKKTYQVSGGLHGVGVSCVNALSKQLHVKVERDGKVYEQRYEKGIPIHDVQETGTTHRTGTSVHFRPDDSIFTTTTYERPILERRLRELAFLNKKIKITFSDFREKDEAGQHYTKEFYSEGGISEYLLEIQAQMKRTALLEQPLQAEFFNEEARVSVAFALLYNKDDKEIIYSYVNNINTIEGGTHVQGFRRALVRLMRQYGEREKIFEKAKVQIESEDFREGLGAIISVKVPEPQFEGQTKGKLGNSEIVGIVDKCVVGILEAYLEENPAQARLLLERIVMAARGRIAARNARESVLKKTNFSMDGLPGKLADCSEKKPEKCELYLVEGDSAGGSAKQGRRPEFQAILPLKGKILNVEKASESKIFDNEEVANIFRALRIRIGTEEDSKALDLSKLRYHKLIIMTDADHDGAHIATLILTLIFRHMRTLIEQGYVYLAQPPLYLVKKGNKYQSYAWNDADRDRLIQQFKQEPGNQNIHIQRYKGLGEMNPKQLFETTMNPQTRILKRVSIYDAINADGIFSILMGEDVEPRKAFIEEHAPYAQLDL